MSDKPVAYKPTAGLCYDPDLPVYWDPSALQAEITRTFEICHGCRMCFKFCDSFPTLFDALDQRHDGDVRKLTADDTVRVMDACFQCKLCEVQCPYTARDGHEYQLDFPRLVHRYAAQQTRAHGIGLRDRVLGDPDRAAGMARASFGIANRLNRVALHRLFFEKLLGIHRKKLLPDFAASTFEAWARRAGLVHPDPGGEVVLFQTCYVQHNEPDIGRDAVDVLQRNQVDVRCVGGLRCCGMPAWEHGDLEGLRARAHHNLALLEPFVERGAQVVAINPTCAMMLRREYPDLVAGADRQRAQRVAAATRDASEFLWSIRKQPRFNTDFKSTPGVVAYHAPCHLRAQSIGFKGRDLLQEIPGASTTTTMECCGHDGTYAMTTYGFDASQRVGRKAIAGVQENQPDAVCTDCPLAALQFQQHAGRKGMHPMSILARAYRADGFANQITPEMRTAGD